MLLAFEFVNVSHGQNVFVPFGFETIEVLVQFCFA
jgi:hypothetical protein